MRGPYINADGTPDRRVNWNAMKRDGQLCQRHEFIGDGQTRAYVVKKLKWNYPAFAVLVIRRRPETRDLWWSDAEPTELIFTTFVAAEDACIECVKAERRGVREPWRYLAAGVPIPKAKPRTARRAAVRKKRERIL